MILKGQNLTAKKRVNSDNKYFNCRKLEHRRQNYILPNYCAKKSKSDKSSSFKQWHAKQNRANILALIVDNLNLKSFRPGKVNMVKEKESSQ